MKWIKIKQELKHMQEGKFEEAAKDFSAAIEDNPDDAVAYINFGNLFAAVGEPEKHWNFFKKQLN